MAKYPTAITRCCVKLRKIGNGFSFGLCYDSWVAMRQRKGGGEMDNRAIIQKSLDYIEDNLRSEISAAELAEMRKQGAWTLGQDKDSSIVYGMPKVAFELGGVQKQVPLKDMAKEISRLAKENQ